jgi:hypothetical protein
MSTSVVACRTREWQLELMAHGRGGRRDTMDRRLFYQVKRAVLAFSFFASTLFNDG